MEGATLVPEKYLVKNNTAGWVGVVKLNHLGEEKGVAVEPYGTVWLSELEITCTARAPQLAEDNPFEEQTLLLTNPETGQREEYKVRPLTLERDARRYTPSEDRYVPPLVPQEAVPAQKKESSLPEASATTPAAGIAAQAPPPAVPPVPPGPQMRRSQESRSSVPQPPPEPESWIQDPKVPGEVLPGRLDGSDEGAPDPARQPEPSGPDERFVPSVVGAQAAPQTPGQSDSEEFAEAVDPAIGEETGRAAAPAGPPEEGEWAWAEEVGAPDAPTHAETEDSG